MQRDSRATWTEADLRALLTGYFGHKLEPRQLDQLIADVAEALAERGRFHLAEREAEWSSLGGRG